LILDLSMCRRSKDATYVSSMLSAPQAGFPIHTLHPLSFEEPTSGENEL